MTTLTKKNTSSMLLKADFFPLTVIQLNTPSISDLQQELKTTTEKAPLYFSNTPIVIDISNLDETEKQSINLEAICLTLSEHNMIPVGVRGLKKSDQDTIKSLGLALFSKHTTTTAKPNNTTKKTPPPNETYNPTKIITKAVRSGTQVYAENSDLIIMAAVNAGAECIADGNIHIYGPLRGRALAGAKGNTNANIFCEKLDAELISIAGRYLVKENISLPRTKKSQLRIYLSNEQLNIEGI